jgi:hypothetical protein
VREERRREEGRGEERRGEERRGEREAAVCHQTLFSLCPDLVLSLFMFQIKEKATCILMERKMFFS